MKLKTDKYSIEFPVQPNRFQNDNYYTVKARTGSPTSLRISIPHYYIRNCCILTDLKRREAKRVLDRFLDQFFN